MSATINLSRACGHIVKETDAVAAAPSLGLSQLLVSISEVFGLLPLERARLCTETSRASAAIVSVCVVLHKQARLDGTLSLR